MIPEIIAVRSSLANLEHNCALVFASRSRWQKMDMSCSSKHIGAANPFFQSAGENQPAYFIRIKRTAQQRRK
jgi:hypothetical protein